ncbi:DoxX family protein [Streptomyces nodosus]|uniref:DoxX family protein n=2 Tax=Streptomyces nodosus TaxID=40318 RepID=A0A0B5DT63_9ACTN|nr:hypothetical protein SNOD_34095 [Streptomyces nodosus]QEV42938.1 DoxX family protein [Streptomyces nodosus]
MIVVSAVFAALLLASAGGKLARQEMQMTTLRKVGFPEDKAWLLGACEVAGAGGLVLGVWRPPLAIAASCGLILYFLGAIASHVRIRDFAVAPAVMMLALAAATAVLGGFTA